MDIFAFVTVGQEDDYVNYIRSEIRIIFGYLKLAN